MSIEKLQIAQGRATGDGGGLFSQGAALTLNHMNFVDNWAIGGNGGAVWAGGAGSSLTVSDTDVVVNGATGSGATGNGGGVAVGPGVSASILRSTISGNIGGDDGGGLYFANGGSLTLRDSTVSGNTASNDEGGGVYFFGAIGIGGFNVQNSTIQGNTAGRLGGGVAFHSASGVASFANSTIANNSAATAGGGIAFSSSSILQPGLVSSIVAKNSGVGGPDFYSDNLNGVTASHSLIGVADVGGAAVSGLANWTGTSANPLDPLLGALGANGGRNQTLKLMPGSPAIDRGWSAPGVGNDERGEGFPRSSGGAADIGAYELQRAPTASVVFLAGAQRSRITSFDVTFSTLVNLSTQPSFALTLTRTIGNGAPVVVPTSVSVTTNALQRTVLHVTVSDPAYLRYGALLDGNYTLNMSAAAVNDYGGQQLDGNGDGASGDGYSFTFRSLFGDADGDNRVTLTDYVAVRMAFGITSPTFDYDNDGAFTLRDFLEFRSRFTG